MLCIHLSSIITAAAERGQLNRCIYSALKVNRWLNEWIFKAFRRFRVGDDAVFLFGSGILRMSLLRLLYRGALCGR